SAVRPPGFHRVRHLPASPHLTAVALRIAITPEGGVMTRNVTTPRHAQQQHPRAPHVLIIVQNLPVPLDRRVWLECQALIDRGYRVSVICPKGPGDPPRQHIDGVALYKYKPAPEAKGLLGFVWE